MSTLLLAEHDNSYLSEETAKAMTAAREIGAAITVLVAGHNCADVAQEAAKLDGASQVIHVDDESYAHFIAEPMADLIVSMASDFSHIMAPATVNGKNILPRVAALLDVMQISEVVEVENADTFKRPIYAGNAIQTVQSNDAIKVMTVRTASFAAAEMSGSSEVQNGTVVGNPGLTSHVEDKLSESDRPELTSAKIIISGGRGMGSAENFQIIERVADKLKAAVGASRAAVDAGYAPNDQQVGQTGKVVAPDLYIAVGISGAIQHLAGMKDSKVIVAINKDEEAPIFQVADYGLVADLFEAVPALEQELDKVG